MGNPHQCIWVFLSKKGNSAHPYRGNYIIEGIHKVYTATCGTILLYLFRCCCILNPLYNPSIKEHCTHSQVTLTILIRPILTDLLMLWLGNHLLKYLAALQPKPAQVCLQHLGGGLTTSAKDRHTKFTKGRRCGYLAFLAFLINGHLEEANQGVGIYSKWLT